MRYKHEGVLMEDVLSLRTIGCKILRKIGRVVENRIFYAIFQVTRVTNDHYGWRPADEESST